MIPVTPSEDDAVAGRFRHVLGVGHHGDPGAARDPRVSSSARAS